MVVWVKIKVYRLVVTEEFFLVIESFSCFRNEGCFSIMNSS